MSVQIRRFTLSSRSHMRSHIVGWSLPLLLLASGCAQTAGETQSPDQLEQRDDEIAQLRRENANLRAEIDSLEERLRLLDGGGAGAAGYADGAGSTSLGSVGYDSYGVEAGPDYYAEADGAPRQLPVVKITPNERSVGSRSAASSPPSAADGRRVSGSISLTPTPQGGGPGYGDGGQYVDARGEGGYGNGGYGDGGYADDSWEPPPDEGAEPASYRLVGSRLVQATKSRPSTPTKKANKSTDSRVLKDYKAAMAVYRDGRFAEAEQAFASIVSAHPNHDYADNALYWQGEAAYDQAHYADALAAFTRVVERYGGGNKAPDALLKIGLCYARLGDQDNARDVLTQLVAAYPRADASKIAKRKLADLD